MNNSEEIVNRADELLELNDYASARDLYRNIALESMPDTHILVNLSVAENYDLLQFSTRLAQSYHDSFQCRHREISQLLLMGHTEKSIEKSTECLIDFREGTEKELLQIRLARLKSSVCSNGGKYLAEDFLKIWDSAIKDPVMTTLRKVILSLILKIEKTSLIPSLTALSLSLDIPIKAIEFIKIKIHELQLMKELTDE